MSEETLRASARDLPAAVADALAAAPDATHGTLEAGGRPWAYRSWGDRADPPVLLVHGVTSDGGTFWRVGPAVAASGRYVVAVDLPGHGLTRAWRGRHRFHETADDLLAFVRAAGLDRPDLTVLGHSWGGMVVAALPAVGLRPGSLILLDPPALPAADMEAMTHDPHELPQTDLDAAIAMMRAAQPTWTEGDVIAKAEGLVRFDPAAALAVLVDNGDWDAGLADLPAALAVGVPVTVIRGEWRTGGLIPDEFVPRLAALLGAGRIVTIADAPHSPQRTHPEALVLAILRALAPARGRAIS